MPETSVITTLFEGKEFRTIEYQNDMWIPLVDLSQVFGLDRTTLSKQIERNPDLFEGNTCLVDKLSTNNNAANEALRCVNEEGLYLLLARLSTSRLKNPAAKDAMIRFRKTTPKLIQKFRKGELTTSVAPALPAPRIEPGQTDWLPEFERQIKAAKVLVEEFGVPKQRAFSTAIFNTSRETGVNINAFQSVLPPIKDEDTYVTVSTIGKSIGMEPYEVNLYLKSKGYLFRDDQGDWLLTEKGRPFGKRVSQNDYGHEYTFIKWKWSIVTEAEMLKYKPLRIKE